MQTTLRNFQRTFARVRAVADTGEKVEVLAKGRRYLFFLVQDQPPQGLYGAAKGMMRIKGNLLSTEVKWPSAK